jgi:hypothetical protein
MNPYSLGLAAVVALMGLVPPAHAATWQYSGDTTGAPTFNRPFLLDRLSQLATAVPYSAQGFSVDLPGAYRLASDAAGWDNFIALYQGRFDAAAPLAGLIAYNDDAVPGSPERSALSLLLSAGTGYVLVTTGYQDADFGAFVNTIEGPGLAAAVPEPSSVWLLMLGITLAAACRKKGRAVACPALAA